MPLSEPVLIALIGMVGTILAAIISARMSAGKEKAGHAPQAPQVDTGKVRKRTSAWKLIFRIIGAVIVAVGVFYYGETTGPGHQDGPMLYGMIALFWTAMLVIAVSLFRLLFRLFRVVFLG